MIEEFLNDYREELQKSDQELQHKIDQVKTRIKENEKFLALLQKDDSDVFTEFSPRELASRNNGKISELEKSLSVDKEEYQQIGEQQKVIKTKLEKIRLILEEEDQALKEEEKKKAEEENEIKLQIKPEEAYSILMKMKGSLDEIVNFVEEEPLKAKTEIMKMVSITDMLLKKFG